VVRSSSFRVIATVVSIAGIVIPSAVHAQQSELSVSPFVTFMPTTGASPLAGLALTLAGNSGLALRASGHLALENSNTTTTFGSAPGTRPWGADADAVLFIGGRYNRGYEPRTIAPYVFAGVGLAATDSLARSTITNNWSYGAGLTIPIAGAVDLFGESRWRMSRFVLPTAHFAPSPKNEFRVGISFHVGGGSDSHSGRRPARSSRYASLPATVPANAYPASTTTSASAARVLAVADKYVGVPYVADGTTPLGFDASGFTQFVFAKRGVQLPRTSREQAQAGSAVAPEWRAVAPGDLVLFADRDQIDHVAIYAGHNRIIHSSASGGGVHYDDLSTARGEWFVDHMVAARRVTPSSSTR